jgi:hypothetical protein
MRNRHVPSRQIDLMEAGRPAAEPRTAHVTGRQFGLFAEN